MDILERLRSWLESYPQWDAGGFTYIDFIDGMPGGAGLYSQGMEEVRRVTDVTGNVLVHCRWNFVLYRIGQRQEDNGQDAAWLMDFQQWVQQQSALGHIPVFGDVPQEEQICARKGRQQKSGASGTVSYSVELTVDFVKYYEYGSE